MRSFLSVLLVMLAALRGGRAVRAAAMMVQIDDKSQPLAVTHVAASAASSGAGRHGGDNDLPQPARAGAGGRAVLPLPQGSTISGYSLTSAA